MSRIDIQTLVHVFEKRIEALEKNPPELVPTSVIINLLGQAIEDVIKEHFVELIKRDLKKLVQAQYQELNDEFVGECIKKTLLDKKLRKDVENQLKIKILNGLR